jgi:ArsR family transcriptional regulator, arsenate/arsenite/antimonite-responsive transcriptional repressor
MDVAQFNRIAKALADPQRFAMLQRIAAHGGGEMPCQCLVGQLPITPATISHHVKELAAAGLIDTRREGKCCHFRFNSAAMEAYRRELARLLRPGGSAQTRRRARPAPRPKRPAARRSV